MIKLPQAKPTQVVVHRIEFQTKERELISTALEDYKEQQLINSAIKAAPMVAVAGGLVYGAWIVSKTWAGITSALNGPLEKVKDEIGEIFEPRDNRTMRQQLQSGDIEFSESGNIYTETILNPKVRDWAIFDIGDLLNLAPQGTTAQKAGDVLENTRDKGWEYLFNIFD